MVGRMLSHYRLVEKIGEGGMGVVWRAEDTVLGRTVAVKVLPADVALEEERRRLFLNEARLAASVSHAHIVQVYDLGREGDLDFIVMEYVEGEPLSRLLHGKPLPLEKVVDYGLQVAEGLARAHHKSLVHRDLKPGNLLVTSEGEVKIVDFGLATLFSPRDSTTGSLASTLTEAPERGAGIVGTLPYMSPEQVRGENLDARSDIFSFGTVLYEMTTGQRPFQGVKAADIAQEILKSQPIPVHGLVPKVPIALEQVIEKALVRNPRDRYQVMDDVAVDLRRLVRDLESRSSPSYEDLGHAVVRAPRRWPRALVAMLAVIAIGMGAWFAWTKIAGRTSRENPTVGETPGRPNWILVAEFEALGADSTLVAAVRDLVIAALQQSRVVTPISRSQLERGLELAGKPPGTRVVGEVARELAYRAAAGRGGTYVEGRIGRVLRGHSIVLDVIRAEDGRVLLSESGVAENEELLIPTIDRLCRDLRKQLGERREELQTGLLGDVMTPSFEAFRLNVKAGQLQSDRDYRSSNQILRQALELDPDFAGAWAGIGVNYRNLGFLDSARTAWDEALRRSERLTEGQRILLEVFVVTEVKHDYAAALRLADLGTRQFPERPGFQNYRDMVLRILGRYEDAYEASVRAGQLSPFGPSQIFLGNQFENLMALGRHQEARQVAQSLKGSTRQLAELTLRLATSEWAGAESLATELQGDPTADRLSRFEAQMTLASLPVTRGAIETSARALEGLPEQAPNPAWASMACLARLHLWIASAGALERPAGQVGTDTTTAGSIVQGIRAAALGDMMTARGHLATILARPAPDGRQYAVETKLLEAWIAAGAGQWSEVIRLLEPSATRGQTPRLTGRLPIRWLVAEAEERLGRLDAAAADFELVLSPLRFSTRWMGQEESVRAIYWPFAHQRLVLLYAKLGRAEEARLHWKVFQETFTHPDPDLAPLVEQARRAIEGLKAAS